MDKKYIDDELYRKIFIGEFLGMLKATFQVWDGDVDDVLGIELIRRFHKILTNDLKKLDDRISDEAKNIKIHDDSIIANTVSSIMKCYFLSDYNGLLPHQVSHLKNGTLKTAYNLLDIIFGTVEMTTMTSQRFRELENNPDLSLTKQESMESWHFCNSWDEMLIHRAFPEWDGCDCGFKSQYGEIKDEATKD